MQDRIWAGRVRPGAGLNSELALVVVAMLLALATAGAAAGQDWIGKARITGLVTTPDGTPIEGATITLYRGQEGQGPEPIKTNKKGRWSFLGLGSGSWTVRIEAEGYQPAERTVPLRQVGPTLEPIEIALKPIAEVAEVQEALRIREQLERGNELLREGKNVEARIELESVLPKLDEASRVPVLVAIARTHYQEDNVVEAIATLEQALTYVPDDVEALRLISSLLVNEGRAGEAEAYIARLPEGEKKLDPNALLNQGIDAYNANDLDLALEQFDKVASEYPDFADVYYYRGLVHLGKANNAEARADFQKLLELAPDHANAGEARQFLEYLQSQ